MDPAVKKDGNYYLQVSLKEYKYTEKKVVTHITQDMQMFSSNSNEHSFFSLMSALKSF